MSWILKMASWRCGE